MILAHGKIYPSDAQDELLASLEHQINRTLEKGELKTETVIRAIDTLAGRIASGEFDPLIDSFAIDGAHGYAAQAAQLLSRENIEYKLKCELGSLPPESPDGLHGIGTRFAPIGTVFHIAAGNADVLPAFSVAEGLLCGNVNILKLPQADRGLTIEILLRLIECEPELAEYIYVFDTPSSDIAAMEKMADMADAIAVWGGEEAVRAVRRLAPAGVKLIEWGHRLSFAYISDDYKSKPDELRALAEHIIKTGQLLCSSCQTVFLNTESMADVEEFCRIFLPYLTEARAKFPSADPGVTASLTLRKHLTRVENAMLGVETSERIFSDSGCSLTACEDSELVLSDLYGNLFVKRLPEAELTDTLRKHKGTLQTAGLLADAADRPRLTDKLIRCGVTRVTRVGNMSAYFSGEAHDGEYSLRRLMRIVNVE